MYEEYLEFAVGLAGEPEPFRWRVSGAAISG